MKVKWHSLPSADFFFYSFSFPEMRRGFTHVQTLSNWALLLNTSWPSFSSKFRLYYCYLLQFPMSCLLGEQTQAVVCCYHSPMFSPEVVIFCFRDHSFVPDHWWQAGLDPGALVGQVLCRCTPLPQLYIWLWSTLLSTFIVCSLSALHSKFSGKQSYLCSSFHDLNQNLNLRLSYKYCSA